MSKSIKIPIAVADEIYLDACRAAAVIGVSDVTLIRYTNEGFVKKEKHLPGYKYKLTDVMEMRYNWNSIKRRFLNRNHRKF